MVQQFGAGSVAYAVLGRPEDEDMECMDQSLRHDVCQFLARLLQVGALPCQERYQCGRHLALLGDPRFSADAHYLPDEPILGFVAVPEGEFAMGEQGLPVNVQTFFIARYHTTVAQYRAFVDATGSNPGDARCLQGDANLPVTWISWYEAVEYCGWLGEWLAEEARRRLTGQVNCAAIERYFWQGLASGDLVATLPSEAEWEKAARGESGWMFPWGDSIDPGKANYKDSGHGEVCAVGSFPEGASPYDVLDMAGNAWEWLRTLWGSDESTPQYGLPYVETDGRENLDAPPAVLRCMRGGAFTVEAARAASTFRDGVVPTSRDDADGFRVVVAPPF